jgi:hypothetical protein
VRESTIGERTFAFWGGDTKDAKPWAGAIRSRQGVEVGALGWPAPSEREVGRGLRGSVSVTSLAPMLDEGAVVLDVEGAVGPLADLLGQADEKSFGPPDVAEPIHVFVLDHFADELRAALTEPGERIVDVLHGEHDA